MLLEILALIRRAREVRANARLTRAELDAKKLEKFRSLVRHARARSPYYAELIAERGIDVGTCTPADFPIMTKQVLMANFDRIVTDPRVTKQGVAEFLTRSRDPMELYLGEYRVMHTSGTSGEVGYFLYSPADWGRGMAFGGGQRRRRFARRPGQRGRLRIAFYGATGGHFAGVTMMSAFKQGIARLIARVEAFEVNSPIAETVAALNAFKPDMLSGYTMALRMLGEQQKAGALSIAPAMIAATGETVTKADMAFLSEAFEGAETTSAYGCTEHLGLGGSDSGGDTMTLNDDNLIFEFFDDHSAITNLFNYTMPLIRYRMSDILIPAPDADPTGRRLVIQNLVGRTERMPVFVTADGSRDFLSPHTINEIFVAGVTRFQMHLTGPADFRFLICLDAALDAQGRAAAVAGVEARWQDILDQKQMAGVSFEVAVVDDLPVNPRTRKFELIVDDREMSPA